MSDTFEKIYGEDVLQEICEHIYADVNKNTDRIEIFRCDKTDIINKMVWGVIHLENQDVYFQIEDGNNNGTVVHDFDNHPLDVPKTRTYIVKRLCIPEQFRDNQLAKLKFNAMRNQDWFQKLERSLNYDSYFSPTDKINNHYKDELNKHNLSYETVEIEGD